MVSIKVMKIINLLSLIQLNKANDSSVFNRFLELNGIEFRSQEILGIEHLIDILNKDNELYPCMYDGFYIGYKIPQIGKEFDLLRFGENFSINIEIKSKFDGDKIREQLIKNKYYLQFTSCEFHYISFIYDVKNSHFGFYSLDESDNLISIDPKNVIEIISKQTVYDNLVVDSLFSPSNYLISPFNSTEKFLDGKYFLTQNQAEVKKEIISGIYNCNNLSKFVCLTGSAGTGKTLLLYDIAYDFIKSGKNVLVVHCGKLNEGHSLLKDKGWDIIPIKELDRHMNEYDIILIDEAQRIRHNQFNRLIEKVRTTNNMFCIFSLDQAQTLSDREINLDIKNRIQNIPGVLSKNLTEKVRTNKEMSDFIKAFFDKNRNNIEIHNSGNIELMYFLDIDSAKNYINGLNKQWKFIQFTPSQYNHEFHEEYKLSDITSHSVIGQEFDNVVVVVDQYFTYNQDGRLSYKNKTYYNAPKMLFQNMTRVRRKIKIIFINNDEVFDRCLRIFL